MRRRCFRSRPWPSRTGLRRGPKSRSAWRSSSAQTGSCSPGGMAAAPQIVDGELSLEMEQVPSSQETGERIVL